MKTRCVVASAAALLAAAGMAHAQLFEGFDTVPPNAGLSRSNFPGIEKITDATGVGKRRGGLARCAGTLLQIYEITKKKLGGKLSTTTFSSAWALLSLLIYKIRTLLSTGFVDNPALTVEAPRRKPLSGAGPGAATDPYWEYAQ